MTTITKAELEGLNVGQPVFIEATEGSVGAPEFVSVSDATVVDVGEPTIQSISEPEVYSVQEPIAVVVEEQPELVTLAEELTTIVDPVVESEAPVAVRAQVSVDEQEQVTNVITPQLDVIDGNVGVVSLGDPQFLSESFGEPQQGVFFGASQPEFLSISEPETISVSQPNFVSVAQPDPIVVVVDQR